MPLTHGAHPFSSCCQKVLIVLHEKATPHELTLMFLEHPQTGAKFARLWPIPHTALPRDGDKSAVGSSGKSVMQGPLRGLRL